MIALFAIQKQSVKTLQTETTMSKALTIQQQYLPSKVTKPMQRFLSFALRVQKPITEEKIIRYYKRHVMRYGVREDYDYKNKCWTWIELTDDEVRTYALMWFDRWMGKMVRLNIVNPAN